MILLDLFRFYTNCLVTLSSNTFTLARNDTFYYMFADDFSPILCVNSEISHLIKEKNQNTMAVTMTAIEIWIALFILIDSLVYEYDC